MHNVDHKKKARAFALQRIQTRDVLFYSSTEVGFQGNVARVLVFAHSPNSCAGGELFSLSSLLHLWDLPTKCGMDLLVQKYK